MNKDTATKMNDKSFFATRENVLYVFMYKKVKYEIIDKTSFYRN